jgi:hypothetical protein
MVKVATADGILAAQKSAADATRDAVIDADLGWVEDLPSGVGSQAEHLRMFPPMHIPSKAVKRRRRNDRWISVHFVGPCLARRRLVRVWVSCAALWLTDRALLARCPVRHNPARRSAFAIVISSPDIGANHERRTSST